MASSKVMASSNSRNSDTAYHCSSSSSSSAKPQQIYSDQTKINSKISRNNSKLGSRMSVDGILRNVYDANPSAESTLLDAQVTLIDTPTSAVVNQNPNATVNARKTVDDVWREIVSGERKEMKEEAQDELMTLEDFLVKAGAVEEAAEEVQVKVEATPLVTERLSGGIYAFDPIPPNSFQLLDKVEGSIIGFGNGVVGSGGSGGGRGKRGRVVLETLDKAAQQRQRRMIKNRESAARSRERKQAYQVELESLAVRLEEENEQLMKEKAERTRERLKQLMEKVVPLKRQPAQAVRALRRVQSFEL